MVASGAGRGGHAEYGGRSADDQGADGQVLPFAGTQPKRTVGLVWRVTFRDRRRLMWCERPCCPASCLAPWRTAEVSRGTAIERCQFRQSDPRTHFLAIRVGHTVVEPLRELTAGRRAVWIDGAAYSRLAQRTDQRNASAVTSRVPFMQAMTSLTLLAISSGT